MKCLFNTIIASLVALFIISAPNSASANTVNGETPVTRADGFQLKQIDKDKVMISCDLVAEGTEYYEVERSENNKDFRTVCVMFPATKEEAMKNALALKDKINNGGKTFYYRLKKVNGENISYSNTQTIELK
jgi:predicted carbohydrate-binding protein with CBM5 and CBM33 domain